MNHEEFLKQVRAAAEVALEPQPVCPIEDVWASYWNATEPQKVLKLLAIIEKLKEQRDYALHEFDLVDADQELDEIVGMG